MTSRSDRLLLINDLINNVNERYQSFKRGDFTVQVTIDPSIDPSKGGADAVPTAKITDLISFEDDHPSTESSQAAGSSTSSVLDDFASLTFGAPTSTPNGQSSTAGTGSSLPLDLFDASQGSTNGGANSRDEVPLGQWGALQLPMDSSSAPASRSGTSTPTPAVRAPQSQAKQAPSSADPFADLSKW